MEKNNLINLGVSFIIAILASVVYGFVAGFENTSTIIITGCVVFIAVSIIFTVLSYFYNAYKSRIENEEKAEFADKYFYHNYSNGIARVEHITLDDDDSLVSEFSYIDKTGNYITDDWFDIATDFNDKGTAQVARDGEFFIINKDGNVISRRYESMMEAEDYAAKVVSPSDGTVNFVNIVTGKEMWKRWKKEI